MRKIYIALCISLLGINANAQLSLTKTTNCPIVGYSETLKDYDSTSAVPKTTGTNKSWNFTSLTSPAVAGSQTYVTTASTSSAGFFPSANIANQSSSWIEYLNSQTTKLEDLGGVDPTSGSKTVFSNPITWRVWPFTYGTSDFDTFAASTTNTSGPTYNFTGNSLLTGTGTGTVTLPGGVKFTNCLQVTRNYTYFVTGAFTATVTSTDYEYWASSYRSPLITITYQTVKEATMTTKDFWASSNSSADVGIEENNLSAEKLIIFPNPVKDQLNLILPDNAVAEEIELYDITGKLILTEKNMNSLNTSSLPKGGYMVIVKNKNTRMQKQIIISE
jgi:hypothetical protein